MHSRLSPAIATKSGLKFFKLFMDHQDSLEELFFFPKEPKKFLKMQNILINVFLGKAYV